MSRLTREHRQASQRQERIGVLGLGRLSIGFARVVELVLKFERGPQRHGDLRGAGPEGDQPAGQLGGALDLALGPAGVGDGAQGAAMVGSELE
ncbi:hypothetical protein D3C87_646020 [compost metagenome]